MIKCGIWAALLCAVVPITAGAHAHLTSSIPAEGSTVTGSPSQVVLGFSESARLAVLTLTRGADTPVKVGPLPQQAAQRLTIALPTLSPGTWSLGWRAIAEDGHVTSGSVHFTVAAGSH
jgi:methionine-rich copper-binding protein CopC